jgi:hypothetical protein
MRQKGVQQNACAIGSTYYFYADGFVDAVGTATGAHGSVLATQAVDSGN